MSKKKIWAALTSSLIAASTTSTANAHEGPYPPLQAQWWQWVLSLPNNNNPLLDKSGQDCMRGQQGDVWLLAGNAGGVTKRSCTVPAGVRLFIPVINVACIYEETPPFNDLSDCLADTEAYAKGEGAYTGEGYQVNLWINGDRVSPHFGQSKAFASSVGKNGLFGFKPGLYPMADVGWYYLSKPLTAGEPVNIRVQGDGYGFQLDVTYDIKVIDAGYPD